MIWDGLSWFGLSWVELAFAGDMVASAHILTPICHRLQHLLMVLQGLRLLHFIVCITIR